MKTALITGCTGQDGSYMAEYLLGLGYEVFGTVRKHTHNGSQHYVKGVQYEYADLRDEISLETVIRKCHPDEIYNFAGQVFVPTSWEQPAETFDVNVGGLARILAIVLKVCPNCRVYQASSSEMYGNTLMKSRISGPTSLAENMLAALNENSPMRPVSPYAASKLAAHKLVSVYRQKGIYAVGGICFNHESPRRGVEMVTRKISRHVGAVKAGVKSTLRLGSLTTRRDWGFAGDYVKAMHLMLQKGIPQDYVIGTGVAHSVLDFLNASFGLKNGTLNDMPDVEAGCPEFVRQNELYTLIADASFAQRSLGWKPETSFEQLVRMMVTADYEYYKDKVCEPTLQQQ